MIITQESSIARIIANNRRSSAVVEKFWTIQAINETSIATNKPTYLFFNFVYFRHDNYPFYRDPIAHTETRYFYPTTLNEYQVR